MKRWFRHIAGLLLAVTLLLTLTASCRKKSIPTSASATTTTAATGDSCAVTDDGGVLDVKGRGDGIYAVRGDRVDTVPLATSERVIAPAKASTPRAASGGSACI